MASTYSPLKIELIGTGDQSGTWGTTTNTNLGTAIEEAITGSADVTFSSSDVTLTLSNTNASQTARNLRLRLIGTSGGARNLTVPDIEKFYLIANELADEVTVKNTTGTTYTVPAGTTGQVFSTGAGIKSTLSFFEGEILSNAAYILGGDIENTPIGTITKSTGGFTTLTSTGGALNGTIGATTPSTGVFTTLQASTSLTVPTILSNVVFNTTGSITLPNGTTGEQPGTPIAGMVRFNSTTDKFEGYDGTAWGPLGGGNKTDTGLWQNAYNITENQTIETGYNASSVGPITIDGGISVTVPTGSTWLVL
jgi:hypothetical protein